MSMRLLRSAAAAMLCITTVCVMSAVTPRAALAQHEGHAGGTHAGATSPDSATGAAAPAWHLMAQAVPVLTRAVHTAGGTSLTEAYLSQTLLMGRGSWWGGRLLFDGALNGEGLTMERGELSTGGFGEGYVDRRHPHTYVHELMLSGVGRVGPLAFSASAGRGFAPFGTDDPMMRPFEKYPMNHHYAQILERVVISGAARLGPVMLEGATFGGDEPTSPSAMPEWRRFGDSWSLRGTVLPRPGVELQGSYARVASPEYAGGFGLDQRKQSVSARWITSDGCRYLLAEWARSVDYDHNRQEEAFWFESALVETAVSLGPLGLALRLEQTDRPEEERLANLFRTPRPSDHYSISGITRWRVATAALTLPSVTQGAIRGYPFVEVARMSARMRLVPSVFSPEEFYGSRAPWMASVGVRLRYGPLHARMGRYGVALPDGPPIRALGGSRSDASMGHHH